MKIKAIKVNYNDSEYFLASFNAKELFPLTAVTRAEESPEDGYQRILGSGRVKKISQYLNEGKVIPGSLILSSTQKKVTYDDANNELTLDTSPASLLVIDGQHRLYGAYQAESDIYLPVCIFFGLDKPTEVQYFLDVNGFQMGVPKTLRLELEKFSAEEDSEEFILKKLFDAVDDDVKSPLSGKMARTKSTSGKISHVAFQNAIKPLLTKNPLNTYNKLEERQKLIINFLIGLESVLVDIFGDNKKIFNAAFFQAIFAAFTDISHVTYLNHTNYKISSFEDTLQQLSKINWDAHQGTNKAAIKALTEDIVIVILDRKRIQDDVF